jgi:hypothetical protein
MLSFFGESSADIWVCLLSVPFSRARQGLQNFWSITLVDIADRVTLDQN